ncbi:MAG: DNA-directed RNA polymerase subunit D [Thaumarchaeota archaeon]|nr:DNA-directed RNA polymerase subunit D [Nitrososphaerota archaeon]
MSLQIIDQGGQKISVKLQGLPLQYVNALRRICLNGIPIFAVDTVDIYENTSILADEGISHRLGLIPLKTELSAIQTNNETDKIVLSLDSGVATETRTVFSNELKSQDDVIKPVSDNIPIVTLAPNQRIKFDAHARLGRGTEHAKWNSANISTLTESDNDDERILTVETTGALEPQHIVLSSVEELSRRLDEFKVLVSDLK